MTSVGAFNKPLNEHSACQSELLNFGLNSGCGVTKIQISVPDQSENLVSVFFERSKSLGCRGFRHLWSRKLDADYD